MFHQLGIIFLKFKSKFVGDANLYVVCLKILKKKKMKPPFHGEAFTFIEIYSIRNSSSDTISFQGWLLLSSSPLFIFPCVAE